MNLIELISFISAVLGIIAFFALSKNQKIKGLAFFILIIIAFIVGFIIRTDSKADSSEHFIKEFWYDNLVGSYTGYYDSRIYSKDIIQNTFDIYDELLRNRFTFDSPIYNNYELMCIGDLEQLEKEYYSKKKDLNNAKFLDDEKTIQNVKVLNRQLDITWKVIKTKIYSCLNSSALMDVSTNPECQQYAKIIESGGDKHD